MDKSSIDILMEENYCLKNNLRDQFAVAALTGLIPLIGIPDDGPDDLWDADTAKRAYELADAMLAERQRKDRK